MTRRIAIYVDGFNLYHAIDELDTPAIKWLDLWKLGESYREKTDTLVSVTYFTAVMKWDRQKCDRHASYIAALKATGVEVIESKFKKSNRYCTNFQRYCDFREEKQTDVAFAVRVLRDSVMGSVDRQILITADSDQIPLVNEVRDSYPQISIEVAAPPNRMSNARELCKNANKYHEITAGRLHRCILPRNVVDDTGIVVAICPARYIS